MKHWPGYCSTGNLAEFPLAPMFKGDKRRLLIQFNSDENWTHAGFCVEEMHELPSTSHSVREVVNWLSQEGVLA